MKKYFIEPDLLPLEQINPKFYFSFIDPISDQLFTQSQLTQFLRKIIMTNFIHSRKDSYRRGQAYNKKAMQVYKGINNNFNSTTRSFITDDKNDDNLSMLSWFTPTPNVATWNKKFNGKSYKSSNVEFIDNNKVHFKQCQESCFVMADYCITQRDCLKNTFSWEIIVDKYSDGAVIGFVDALNDSTIQTNSVLKNTNINSNSVTIEIKEQEQNNININQDEQKTAQQVRVQVQQPRAQAQGVAQQQQQQQQQQQPQQQRDQQQLFQGYMNIDLSYYWHILRDFMINFRTFVSNGYIAGVSNANLPMGKPNGFRILDYQPNNVYVFRFEVNFCKRHIQVFDNGESCGVLFDNIGRAIIPAVSTSGGEAQFHIRFCS